MRKLSDKQREAFSFILEYYTEHGRMPDYPAFQEALGYRSPNSVYQLLQALIKKQHLIRSDHGQYDLHPDKFHLLEGQHDDNTGIPILGRIAAGGMHEAIPEDLGRLPVELLTWRSDRLFALQVNGDSMIDADIRDGDYIILDRKEPRNGEIGAVLYNGETTLKRIHRTEKGVELRPENPNYNSIHIRPDEWEEVGVLGTYVGKAWQEPDGWRLFFRTR